MSSQDPAKKRSDIQILRAISVIAVIIFHLDERWLPGGFLGVDVFFVISGFLITGILTRSLNDGSFSLSGFYLRRIKRLFPALAVMLMGATLLGIVCLPPLPFEGLADHLPFAALQVSNFSFMRGTDYFGPDTESNPLLHTWSLGVEEQYYLTWAPLLAVCYFLFRKKQGGSNEYRPILLIWVIIVGGIAAEWLTRGTWGDMISFFSPLSRSWELALGGLASIGMGKTVAIGKQASGLNRAVGSLGYVLIGVSLFYLGSNLASNPFLRFLPCLGALLALRFPFTVPGAGLNGIRSLLVYIGDISYSLYLWHWPIICLIPYMLSNVEGWMADVCAVVLFLLLSMASYRWVERPCMHQPKWNRLLGVRTAAFGLFLLVLAGGGYALQTESDSSWRFDSGTPTEEERRYTPPLQYNEYKKRQLDRDIPFERVRDARVILIGDSHARHFAPVIQAWARERNRELVTFHSGGFFAPGRNTQVEKLDHRGNVIDIGDRSNASRKLMKYIQASSSIEICFLALRSAYYTQESLPHNEHEYARCRVVEKDNPESSYSSDEWYTREITGYIMDMRKKGIKVVLLGQVPPLNRVPKPGASILDQILKRDWSEGNTQLDAEQSKRLDLEDRVYRKLAEDPGIYYFRTRDFLDRTHTEDGYFLYDDSNHIKYQGAMYLFDELNKLPL